MPYRLKYGILRMRNNLGKEVHTMFWKRLAMAVTLLVVGLPALSTPRLTEYMRISYEDGIPTTIEREVTVMADRKVYTRYEGDVRWITVVDGGKRQIVFWEPGSKVAYASGLSVPKALPQNASVWDVIRSAVGSDEAGRRVLQSMSQRKRAGEAMINGTKCSKWTIDKGEGSYTEMYEDERGRVIYTASFFGGKLIYQSILVRDGDVSTNDWKDVAIPPGVKITKVPQSELGNIMARSRLRARGLDIRLPR